MKETSGYQAVASQAEILVGKAKVVRLGAHSIALFRLGDEIIALDNRCPHMGFPLDRGTEKDGILTCHWHHARFDIGSGCAFDLFADDIPVFDTFCEDGKVFVSKTPKAIPGESYYGQRLKKGLEQNIGLVQSKSVIGLLESKTEFKEIVRQIARFGGANHENWNDGMTSLAVVANLWPDLSDRTRIFALSYAARRLADNCADRPSRRDRNQLAGSTSSLLQLKRWFRDWLVVRQRDGAERTVLTAAAISPGSMELNDLLFAGVSDRIFSNTGHTLDFFNKAFELLDFIGWEEAEGILPTLMPQASGARGGEEQSSWRSPVDLIEIIRSVEAELPSILSNRGRSEAPLNPNLEGILWGNNPATITESIASEIARGVNVLAIAKQVCYTAAMRLVRFPESNDIADWFNPVHTFNFSNAVYQSLKRGVTPDTVKAIFHAAMATYKDRFLNIPEAPLPGDLNNFENLPEEPELLREQITGLLDHRQNLNAVTGAVAKYVRLRHPLSDLIDTLAMATLREDLDFHKIQVLEAGVSQARLWQGRPEEENIFVGIARHLAAHCPTRRGESRMTQIAVRLQRDEVIYDSAGE